MRLFGLTVLLTALSACAGQAPRSIAPTMAATSATIHAAVPFEAVAPADYCLSDESDVIGARVIRTITDDLEDGDVLLGVFRPCHEPSPPSANTVVDRLALVAYTLPPASAEEAKFMDRRMFLTMMANPKVSVLLGERLRNPALRSSSQLRLAPGGLQYLGTDDYGVYNGYAMLPAEPNRAPQGGTQSVFGMSLTGDHGLMGFGVSAGLQVAPHSQKMLQQMVSELLRGTIIAAERPARARPAARERPAPGMPAPASPATPAGAGLTT